MPTVAARTELESQQLKFEAPDEACVSLVEVRQHSQEEGIALYSFSPSLALRSSAEPVCWAV